MIIFDSVRFIYKKSNQTEFKKKKKTETELKPVQTDRFWFGSVFRTKTGSNRFGSGFFQFGSVQFGFFSFSLIKPKPNRTEPAGFFKILISLIGFFSRFGFIGYFFSWFSQFIRFFYLPLLVHETNLKHV
jgi:hypothetical protein